MKNLHFLLVGGTHPHARAHLKTLQQLPEVERVTVVESDASARDFYGSEKKVVGAVPTLREGLATDATHVFLCSRNDVAPADIESCARAGRHILAEKPLAVSASALERARRAVQESGVTFSVEYQARWHPISMEARRLVAEGVLGEPIAAEARMVTSQVRYRNPSHWLFSKKLAGGGILSWLGCHYLDLLAYLLDDEYVSVGAHLGTLNGAPIDVEDVAMLTLRFSRRTLATMTSGYLLALSPTGYQHGAYDTYIGVYGTEGRLWWDPVGGKTLHVESARSAWAGAPRRESSFEVAETPAYGGVYGEVFVRQFIRASFGDGEPPTTIEDGQRVLRVIDAAYRSSAEGAIVSLATGD